MILLTTGTSFWNGASHYLEASVATASSPTALRTSSGGTAMVERTAGEDVVVNGETVTHGRGLMASRTKPKST